MTKKIDIKEIRELIKKEPGKTIIIPLSVHKRLKIEAARRNLKLKELTIKIIMEWLNTNEIQNTF